jgi:hypothetical protein
LGDPFKAAVRKVSVLPWTTTRQYLLGFALCFVLLTTATAEGGKWDLEERRNFVFTLSYKQSATINNRLATSELAFICDQRIVGVLSAQYWCRLTELSKTIRTPLQMHIRTTWELWHPRVAHQRGLSRRRRHHGAFSAPSGPFL